MFSNLPGKVTTVREPTVCEFEQWSYFETMKEIIDANKASEALKLQYAKGEDWQCESQATTRIQGETDSFDLSDFVTYVPRKPGGGLININPLRNKPGCYLIRHKVNGMFYVGSSNNLAARLVKNLSALRNNCHKNRNLQTIYNNDPHFEIVYKVTETVAEANKLEQAIVTSHKEDVLLLNIAKENVLLTRQGVCLSEAHKAILLESNKNRVVSDETRTKLRESHLGNKLTEEHKEKLSSIHKARLSSEEGKRSHAAGIAKLKHAVYCDGILYSSMSEAARSLGVDITTILYRCKSSNYPTFYKMVG